MEEQKKKSKISKKVIIPALAILLIGCVVALGVYFYNTDVTLTVTEARESADLPVTLTCFSGETETWTTTIKNKADVDLKAQLVFEEVSNPNGVIYTTTAPVIVDLKKLSDTTQDVSITCDEITPAGVVTGILHYAPYKAT